MELISTVERAVSHHREVGKFLVLYRESSKEFPSLVSAFIFYYNLKEAASLWDMTENSELLEQKIIKACQY